MQTDATYDSNGDGVMEQGLMLTADSGVGQTPQGSLKVYVNNDLESMTIIEEDFSAQG